MQLSASPPTAGVAPVAACSALAVRKSADELSEELVRLSGEPAATISSLVAVDELGVGVVVMAVLLQVEVVTVVGWAVPHGSQADSSLHQSKEEEVLTGPAAATDEDQVEVLEVIQQSEEVVVAVAADQDLLPPAAAALLPADVDHESLLLSVVCQEPDCQDEGSSLRGRGT